jgi:hypothetical protein
MKVIASGQWLVASGQQSVWRCESRNSWRTSVPLAPWKWERGLCSMAQLTKGLPLISPLLATKRRFGVPSPKSIGFRCDQNGPSARRSEPDWRLEGAYLNGYVTDEQRSRRPIFIATLRAAASWLFFRVARSSRIDSDMLVARALKNSQLTCGEWHAISATVH